MTLFKNGALPKRLMGEDGRILVGILGAIIEKA